MEKLNYISAVPTKWIHYKNDDTKIDLCWPRKKQDISKAISKGISPEDDWHIIDINKVLGAYSNYKEALYFEKMFTNSSASEEEIQNNKRRRKKNRKYRDDSISPLPELSHNDSDTDDEVASNSKVPLPLLEPLAVHHGTTEQDILEAEIIYHNSNSPTQLYQPFDLQLLGKELQQVKEEIITMKTHLMIFGETLHDIHRRVSGINIIEDFGTNLLPKLPTNSIIELRNFEVLLSSNEQVKPQLLTYLKYTGGKSVKHSVVRCLEKIFTNEVAQFCSWTGQKGNFRLNDQSFMNILKSAVKLNHPAMNDEEFEKCVMAWFQHAKTRVERKKS